MIITQGTIKGDWVYSTDNLYYHTGVLEIDNANFLLNKEIKYLTGIPLINKTIGFNTPLNSFDYKLFLWLGYKKGDSTGYTSIKIGSYFYDNNVNNNTIVIRQEPFIIPELLNAKLELQYSILFLNNADATPYLNNNIDGLYFYLIG